MVTVNGVRLAWLDFTVNNNSYYQADSFNVTFGPNGANVEDRGNAQILVKGQATPAM